MTPPAIERRGDPKPQEKGAAAGPKSSQREAEMATIKIYGIPVSQNVRKPLAVAAHIGVEVENIPVRPQDPVVTEKYAGARIPFLEEGDTVLGESNAIMIHLASKTKNDLYPENAAARNDVNHWLFWDVAHWTPSYQPIQFERLVKQFLGLGAADEAVVEATLVKFRREAAYLDKALAGREFLVGAAPTLADFAVGCGLTHARAMDLPLSDYPNVAAWNARLLGLEGFRQTAM